MIYVPCDSLDPYYNFALEEHLALSEKIDFPALFMFWRTDPTIMIGRFQNTMEEINQNYIEKNNIQVVRRNSGGGAIYTDPGIWQFSFIVKDYERDKIDFKGFVDPVIKALKKIGVNAELTGRNDLLVDGKKICGNAQFMKSKSMVHHGSILFDANIENMTSGLRVSEEKIKSKGVKSISSRVANISDCINSQLTVDEFRSVMLDELLEDDYKVYHLTEEDKSAIKHLYDRKFNTWDWNYGKSPKFTITKSKRYAGGKIEFNLNIEDGIIKDCKIYGDFFSLKNVGILEEGLVGIKYRKNELRQRLDELNAGSYIHSTGSDDLLDCLID
ncbi:lipoate--protein ligase [Metaclostridioides mangenotii]|uniref:lipoate--protein ligase n=1 Tax=Metaclostridioides mangenotii TaxID=1540 RepID=UPI000481E2E7|nr:lipoate--protein ligase [Clostridioides mangenotii]